MRIDSTSIDGVCAVSTIELSDVRGSFTRLFCSAELADVMDDRTIVQVNRSITREVGTIRGLHFQNPPHAEMKLVRCVRGRVWDVVVDFRRGSATFLQWHAEELSDDNDRMLVVPEGCAHGFQAIEEDSELLYLMTSCHQPAAEGGFRFDDARLAIEWPLSPSGISVRDASLPPVPAQFLGIEIAPQQGHRP